MKTIKDEVQQEIRKTLQSTLYHGTGIISAELNLLEAFETYAENYHQEKLKSHSSVSSKRQEFNAQLTQIGNEPQYITNARKPPVSVESKVTDELCCKCEEPNESISCPGYCFTCEKKINKLTNPDIKKIDRKADLIKFAELLEENTIDIVYYNDEQDMNYLIDEYLNTNK